MTVLAVAPLLVSAVLVAGAVGKLRHPDDDGWAALGVPAVLRREWLQRLHPWGELLLAGAVALLGGGLGLLAGVASVALFTVYLVLVVRARMRDEGASCSCFGARRPITAVTVVRNAWFLLLAVATAGTTWTMPVFGGPALALGADLSWLPALAAAALTVALSLWHPAPASAAVEAGVPVVGAGGADAEPGEYVRARTPAVPVMLADGRTVNLRDLAARGPMLLLAVKEDCGACRPVIEAVPRWRALLPEVAVRFLLWPAPENSSLTEYDEPQSLHDRFMYVQGSIADWSTPAAVLVGADGYLAGGPVSGYDEIEAFIGDVYEVLHGERPPSSTSAG
ncbi:MauE/DoxX family redox-associated membrane protein [Microbacterium sp.]|uniref:MauE/DoxX family redox-associated membrane protein n=1 Tax=Microbacterium sp. TaxID=51671 RepID=UPI0028112D4F|nr:MauE/DoxX family redox-associated membrane protein [Microbacterium sp.]